MRHALVFSSLFLLTGCFATGIEFPEISSPDEWVNGWFKNEPEKIEMAEARDLERWWLRFGDESLNELIDIALKDSPSRKIAEARILEARGLRKSTFASLFPQISGSAAKGREDTALGGEDDFYDARFDASYEVDIFGVNRKVDDAAESQVRALEADYHDVTLTLIADIARSYIAYRGYEKQVAIAKRNLDLQTKTMDLITDQFDVGEGNKLDVMRASNLVNTTRAAIPEFQRQANNAKLQLSVLVGREIEGILPILDTAADIPGADVKPVLMTPAAVLQSRPDIRGAQEMLSARTSLAESTTVELLPSFTISGFLGVTDSALANSATIWNVAAGAAMSILDFGRIAGRIDAARAREVQAFEAYRLTILRAVSDVETALNDYASINRQRASLQQAYDDADQSLKLSDQLFKEGEISFIDLLDAQRLLNRADSDLVSAQMGQTEALIRLYKSLGVY